MEKNDSIYMKSACERYFRDLKRATFRTVRFDMFLDVENDEDLPSTCADVYIDNVKWSVIIELKPYSDGMRAVKVWMTNLSDMKVPPVVFHANPVTLESDYRLRKEGRTKFEENLCGWKRKVAKDMKFYREDRPIRFRDVILNHVRSRGVRP